MSMSLIPGDCWAFSTVCDKVSCFSFQFANTCAYTHLMSPFTYMLSGAQENPFVTLRLHLVSIKFSLLKEVLFAKPIG